MRLCSMAVQSNGLASSGNIHNHFGAGSDYLGSDNAGFGRDGRRPYFSRK
jgi:hypothetical protein